MKNGVLRKRRITAAVIVIIGIALVALIGRVVDNAQWWWLWGAR
jgi:hypothetical protein